MAKTKKENPNQVYVTAKIPKADYDKLLELKAKTGYSIADLIRSGIRAISNEIKS